MAYSAPHIFAHGEYPTAANMNIYSDGLNAIYDALSSGKPRPPSAKFRQYETRDSDTHNDGMYLHPDFSFLTMPYLARWLFYSGEGKLHSFPDLANQVSLPNSSEINIYDLTSIPWLIPGMIMKITDVKWAFADWEP